MRRTRILSVFSLASLLALGVVGATACREEGPAERAGEQIDETADDMRDRAEDATD